MSKIIVEFRDLPKGFEWYQYQQLFSEFGTIKKLFIDPEGAFGKVYFEKLEDAQAAIEELNGKPPLHLVLSEPMIADYLHNKNTNKNTLSNTMNQFEYQNQYHDYDIEGNNSKFQYVDVFGRLVSTFEGEDGDLYVSLSELKKSGFELYQAGSLPKPGQSKIYDEELQYQFELYLKMKAKKFLALHKINISKDSVSNVLKKEINQYVKNDERIVKMDTSGLLKISASPGLNSDFPHSTRKRMSFVADEPNNYEYNRTNQKSRMSMPSMRAPGHSLPGRQADQRNNSEFNNRFSGRLGYSQRHNSNDSLNSCMPDTTNSRNNSYLAKSSTRNQNTNENHEFKRPVHHRQNSDFDSQKQFNYNRHRGSRLSAHSTDDEDTHAAVSLGKPKLHNETNTGSHISSNEAAAQKVQDSEIESNKQSQTIPVNAIKQEIHSDISESLKSCGNDDITPETNVKRRVSFIDSEDVVSVGNDTLAKESENTSLQVKAVETLKDNYSLKSVVEISTSDTGIFQYVELLNKDTLIAFVFPNRFSDDLCKLELISNECAQQSEFKPNKGDLITVLNETEHVRGRILKEENGKYICALVDFGTIITTSEVCPLPDEFKSIPEFACICKADPSVIEDIVANGKGNNIPISITAPGKLTLELVPKECKVTASKWNPFETPSVHGSENKTDVTEKQKEVEKSKIVDEMVYKLLPPVHNIKDKDIVMIIAEQNGNLLLRTRECNAIMKQINQELNSYKGIPIEKSLEIGQLAIASFNNDGLYRIKVVAVKSDIAIIEYIDYGNFENISVKKLLAINEKLAKMDNTLIKITLKGFSDNKFSEKALKVLEECNARKEKFTVIKSDLENEYDLLSGEQVSLSERLKSLDKLKTPPKLEVVQKSSPRPPVVKPTITETRVNLGDLPSSKIKIGINEVMCMHTGDLKHGNVSFCIANEETSRLMTEVQLKIVDHVEKPIASYKPEEDEVCLAKFEDEWCRACVTEKDEDNYSVYFIDFGNSDVVTAMDICKIPRELIQIQPLASLCVLKDVLCENNKVIQETLLTQIQKDLLEHEIYNINVTDDIEGYLVITIPNLYEKWKKQGLL